MAAAYSFQSEPESTSLEDLNQIDDRHIGIASFVEALRLLVRNAVSSNLHHSSAATMAHGRQRRYLRKPIAVRASCGGDWGTSDCLISDISEGGASVVCGHTPKIGDKITLEWPAATPQQNLRILCSVRHVSRTHTGVAFVGITADKLHDIAALVRAS